MENSMFLSCFNGFFRFYGKIGLDTRYYLSTMLYHTTYHYPYDHRIKLVEFCGDYIESTPSLINRKLGLWSNTLEGLSKMYFLLMPKELAHKFISRMSGEKISEVEGSQYDPIYEMIYIFFKNYYYENLNTFSLLKGDNVLFRMHYNWNKNNFELFSNFISDSEYRDVSVNRKIVWLVKAFYFFENIKKQKKLYSLIWC